MMGKTQEMGNRKEPRYSMFSNRGVHYFRYLVSLILIMLLPLVVLSFYFNARFMVKFYEEVYETVDMELQQISIQIDEHIGQMREASMRLSLDPAVKNALKVDSPYRLKQTMDFLAILNSANDNYDEIILNPKERRYLVTSSTTWNREFFYDHNFTEERRDEAKKLLERRDIPNSSTVAIPGASLSHYFKDSILYVFPFLSGYGSSSGTIIFLVSLRTFDTLISTRLNNYNAQIFITDASGNLLFTNSAADDFAKYRNSRGFEKRSISSKNGWTYYAFLSKSQTTFAQVDRLMKEYLVLVLLLLVVGAIAIHFLQRINYAPIKNLSDKAKELVPEQSTNNEFQKISAAIEFLSIRSSSLESTLEENVAAIKNSRINRLINGGYQSLEDFNLDNNDLNMNLSHSFSAILLLLLSSPIQNTLDYAESLRRRLSSYNLFYTTGINREQLVFILNTEENSTPHELALKIQMLAKDDSISMTIGIGSTVKDIGKLAQSFIEATSALDYRFIKGSGTIIEFKEIIGRIGSVRLYPNAEILALSNALYSRNTESIMRSIDALILILHDDRLPIYLARSICSDIIQLIKKNYAGKETEDITLRLTKADSLEKVIHMAEEWKEIVRKTKASDHRPESTTMNKIKEYIDEHCLECEFSAYETASRFNMTLPVLSRSFKEYFDQNLIDYTTAIRMDTAKMLLEDQSISISDIAQKVGYYNLSSFTRRFKQNFGISPSEFRANAATFSSSR